MNNRIIAGIQLAINWVVLLFVSALYFGAYLAIARFFYVPGPVDEPLASWWVRVAQNIQQIVAEHPYKILIIVFALAYQIFVLWLCKQYADPKQLNPVPFWVYLLSGLLPGLFMIAAWRGIRNAHEINASKMPITFNKKWGVISLMAGSSAFIGVCVLLWLAFLPGGPAHDSLFADIFIGASVLSILCFAGFNHAALLVSGPSASAPAPPDPATREAWTATWNAWRDGLYDSDAQNTAGKLSVDAFISAHAAFNRVVASAAKQRPFNSNEFIVGVSPRETFVLTNLTLYLFSSDNPLPNPAVVIPLRDIQEYRFEKQGRGRVIIKFFSGFIVEYPILSAPNAEMLLRFSKESRATSDAGTQSGD